MASIQASGTQTAVISTEHTLADLTAPAVLYQLMVDVSNMASGDSLELRIYTKILSGGALSNAVYAIFTGAPSGNGDQVQLSPPVFSDQEIKFTLRQTAGTGRAYAWKVVSF